MKKSVSIILPVFNEENTVSGVIENLIEYDLGVKKEIIAINDGSQDMTIQKLKKYSKKIIIIDKKKNEGKGRAVRDGINIAKGDIITIQDADLEYPVENINKITKPIIENNADVVYGSRFLKKSKEQYKIILHYLGNKTLNFVCNLLFGSNITDLETGSKAFKKEIIKNLKLSENGFGFEAEVTSKLLKKNIKIIEVPIDYHPRTFKEGKKITFVDGIKALKILLMYWADRRGRC